MKNTFLIILGIIAIFVVGIIGIGAINGLFNKDKNTKVTNDVAEKDTDSRYLTIVNDTDQLINEVIVLVGEGTEIEQARQKNPNEKSFSIKIPTQYNEYKDFTVVLIDRYGLKYQKTVTNMTAQGRVEVKINENDYVKQRWDIMRKINKFFNGD